MVDAHQLEQRASTTAPVSSPGQLTPIGTQTLPTPRLPGTAGSGPAVTSGVNDTVVLDRPNANITVTLDSGSYDIRKLYMRETLNITGGSLNINYAPSADSTPISAQFSGPVTLSGTGSLSVNTLQVDASKIFTLAGSTGTLTFKAINLLSSSQISLTGDANINPLSNATATISGSGTVNLNGGTRVFNVGNGSSDVDLDVAVPIANGGLTKNGTGTMRLSGNNTFAGPVTVNAGTLRYNHSSGLQSSTAVTINNGGVLDMNNIADTIASLSSDAGNTTGLVMQGSANLTLAANSGTSTYLGTISGSGALMKTSAATQILGGNNSLGAITLSAGSLLFNGFNTTGGIAVNGGVLGGEGVLSGAVTVNSGGRFTPGASIESLGVGALTLNAGSVLDLELGASSMADRIDVAGLLSLNGGSLNFIDAGGMGIGFYNLISYGTLSGSLANVSAPSGSGNLDYQLLDTGSAIFLVVSLPGDFNFDGTVNAADYAVWRKGLGTTYSQADYDTWRAHFGEVASSGSSLGSGAAVPESATIVLLACGLMTFGGWRTRRRQLR